MNWASKFEPKKWIRLLKGSSSGCLEKLDESESPPSPTKKHYKKMLIKKKKNGQDKHPPYDLFLKKRGELAPFRERTLPVIFDSPPVWFFGEKKSAPKSCPIFFEFPAPSPATGFLDFFSESKQDLSMKIRFDVKWGFKEICTTNLYWNFVIANCLQWLQDI